MRLRPGESFPISWRVSIPGDTATYYVQAKIRNSRTRALLATVNLTDNGDGSHSYNWQVPQDASGLGFYVDMEVTAYTDSGRTTASTNYQVEHKQYQIKEEMVNFGGGAGVDYDVMKKIFTAVLVGAIKEYGLAEKTKFDMGFVRDLFERFDTLQFALEQEIEKQGKSIKGTVVENKVEVKPTDLSPIVKVVGGLRDEVAGKLERIEKAADQSEGFSQVSGSMQVLQNIMEGVRDVLNGEVQTKKKLEKYKQVFKNFYKLLENNTGSVGEEEDDADLKELSKFLADDDND